MFLTPVIYPITAVPEKWRWVIYLLNPMAQIVDLSRWSLLGVGEHNPYMVAFSIGAILLTVVGAIAFFLRAESILADEM
jgi:lipopolysaccharide transport system permease protein